MPNTPLPAEDVWLAHQLLRIAELTADFRGARYLQALVLSLTRLLQVRFAMVVMRADEQEIAQVVAMADGEDMRQPFRYSVERLPCKTVLNGEPVAMHCNVMEFFPGAADVEGYVGHPLQDRDGRIFGLLAIYHSARLSEAKSTGRLLRALSGRVAAELETEPELWPAPAEESSATSAAPPLAEA